MIYCLQLCIKLAFGTIFMYWSIAAISKYISGPITSIVMMDNIILFLKLWVANFHHLFNVIHSYWLGNGTYKMESSSLFLWKALNFHCQIFVKVYSRIDLLVYFRAKNPKRKIISWYYYIFEFAARQFAKAEIQNT